MALNTDGMVYGEWMVEDYPLLYDPSVMSITQTRPRPVPNRGWSGRVAVITIRPGSGQS